VTALTVPDVLRRAEQVVAERGWCQGDYEDEQGHVCAEGAMNLVIWGKPHCDDMDDATYALARAALEVLSSHVGCFAINWNDDEARTESEVRAALLAAAQRAEAGT
jgi:hypothetical protein